MTDDLKFAIEDEVQLGTKIKVVGVGGGGSNAADYIEWLTIKDLKQSVVNDVARIRTHPLVPATIPIYGYVYDVSSGKLIEVPEAMHAGKADAQARAAKN